MEKKIYWVCVGYCGPRIKTEGNEKYGYSDRVVPVYCTEDELEGIATAVGKGYLADSCVVYDNERCNRYERPMWVLWDCM